MEQNKREFLETVCKIYMTALLVLVPLATGGSYWKLGDRKYLIFRNVSLLCLGIWLLVTLSVFLAGFVQKSINNHLSQYAWSPVDICMLLYAISVVISALASAFRVTAWLGYQDWYMGALSQLLFVGGYFFVSRYCTSAAFVVYLGEAAFLVVILIAFLNRLGLDPLGMYQPFAENEWEYSHMLSTAGNINWLCGYCSVAIALPMAGYLYTKRRGKEIILYLCSVLGLTLLCIQGSDGGVMVAMVGIGICLLVGIRKAQFFKKGLLLTLGVCLLFPTMGRLITMLGAQNATPVDGGIYEKMCWNGWWLIALFLAVVYLVHGSMKGKAQRHVAQTLIGIGVAMAAGMCLYVWGKLDNVAFESLGSGRGKLWQLAWEAFVTGDWKQKLIGAGPDCYAEYLTRLGMRPVITDEGYWAGAVFANAHNEWLNQLVNLGIVGTGAYLAIFVCGLKRYKGMLLGVLVLGMYGVHSLVSFQQVLNAPLLFLVLGMCEATCRKNNDP